MSDTTAQPAQQDFTPTPYVVADASGAIQITGSVPRFMLNIQPLPEGGSLVEGAGTADTHYVTGGAIVGRPANPATLAGMTLTNVPVNATVTINGTDYTVTDGTVELSFSQPGSYPVKVSAWPMLDATFQVTQP